MLFRCQMKQTKIEFFAQYKRHTKASKWTAWKRSTETAIPCARHFCVWMHLLCQMMFRLVQHVLLQPNYYSVFFPFALFLCHFASTQKIISVRIKCTGRQPMLSTTIVSYAFVFVLRWYELNDDEIVLRGKNETNDTTEVTSGIDVVEQPKVQEWKRKVVRRKSKIDLKDETYRPYRAY